MFKNHFKTAWRNLIKSKGYSAINIGGLAVGKAVAMLIGLWVYDKLNYDKYHTNYGVLNKARYSSTSRFSFKVGEGRLPARRPLVIQ